MDRPRSGVRRRKAVTEEDKSTAKRKYYHYTVMAALDNVLQDFVPPKFKAKLLTDMYNELCVRDTVDDIKKRLK